MPQFPPHFIHASEHLFPGSIDVVHTLQDTTAHPVFFDKLVAVVHFL
jgi:hypothetical protein